MLASKFLNISLQELWSRSEQPGLPLDWGSLAPLRTPGLDTVFLGVNRGQLPSMQVPHSAECNIDSTFVMDVDERCSEYNSQSCQNHILHFFRQTLKCMVYHSG